MEANSPPGIPYAPAPWVCKCRAWWILTSSGGRPLADDAYHPLEEAYLVENDVGSNARGPGMIQIVRYSETPVGAYDELLLIPGAFTNPKVRGKYNRITRIYVNQRATCWNGRYNWNVPKHLARFVFEETPDSLSVKVFPPDEDEATARPFFSAILRPFKYLPAIPFSIRPLTWFLGDEMVLPPLPGSETEGEGVICPTEHWKRFALGFYARKMRLMWVEVSTPGGGKGHGKAGDAELHLADDDHGSRHRDFDGWWPSYGTWKVGCWMEEGNLSLTAATELE